MTDNPTNVAKIFVDFWAILKIMSVQAKPDVLIVGATVGAKLAIPSGHTKRKALKD